MLVEKTIHIRMVFHDEESETVDLEDLTEFIIDTLNNEFRKDCITFEKAGMNG